MTCGRTVKRSSPASSAACTNTLTATCPSQLMHCARK